MSPGSPAPHERPTSPDAPMLLDGGFAPGDPEVMLRCLLEEYLLAGTSAADLEKMLRDPRYGAFAFLRNALGDERVARVFCEVSARTKSLRAAVRQRHRVPPCLHPEEGD